MQEQLGKRRGTGWGEPMSLVDRKEGREGEGWEGPISSTYTNKEQNQDREKTP